MKKSMFCELTEKDMLKIEGGKNIFRSAGYYVGRALHYLCEEWSHIYG